MKMLKVVSLNMHKGFGPLGRDYTLLDIRKLLESVTPDVVFLQEIHGVHPKTIEKQDSPLEILADEFWPHFRHGVNAVTSGNFHGNGILSRFPIAQWDNSDISTNFLEKRGLLHASISPIPGEEPIDLFCTHLNLFPSGQLRQIHEIRDLIEKKSQSSKIILAGDFNDWTGLGRRALKKLGYQSLEAYKTFPSPFPILSLDQIFYKGLFLANSATSLDFQACSDHIPLIAEFNIKTPDL